MDEKLDEILKQILSISGRLERLERHLKIVVSSRSDTHRASLSEAMQGRKPWGAWIKRGVDISKKGTVEERVAAIKAYKQRNPDYKIPIWAKKEIESLENKPLPKDSGYIDF